MSLSRTEALRNQNSNSLTQLIADHRDKANKPIGIQIFGICFRFKSEASKRAYYQGLVLLMTFIAYTAFHMGRRPLSVVKNVLNRDCSRLHASVAESMLEESDSRTVPVISEHNQPDQHNVLLPQPVVTQTYNTIDNHINNNQYEEAPNSIQTDSATILPPPYETFYASTQRPMTALSQQTDRNTYETGPEKESSVVLAKDTSCDWAPFDNDDTANRLLAYLDMSFLASYAIFMFFSGSIAERTNLRYFITMGSIFSGLGLIAFGISYHFDIHSMGYFVMVQIISGAAQSTGWPVVVTSVSNWFDRSKLGTIYGLWNSHTSLGNILGATIAGYYVETDWGLSFIVPGVLMILVGVLMFLFLVPTPQDVGLISLDDLQGLSQQTESANNDKKVVDLVARGGAGDAQQQQQQDDQRKSAAIQVHSKIDDGSPMQRSSDDGNFGDKRIMASKDQTTSGSTGSLFPSSTRGSREMGPGASAASKAAQQHSRPKPISFINALKIPGVLEYSFCLFFSKLVSYTFLYWLPRYITSSTSFNSSESAYLSTPFDVGGILGSILAGWLSDRFKVNGIICNIMLLLAIPSMFTYQKFGARSSWHNIWLQILVGSLVNGPYCLITTAVSADLGNRIKDGQAMATVSAIIDGMGSVGAVLGPLFAGLVPANNWGAVFAMLMAADVLASLCIIRVTVQDFRAKFGAASPPTDRQQVVAA